MRVPAISGVIQFKKKSFVSLSMEFWEIREWAPHLHHFTIPTLPPRFGFSPSPSKIHGLVFFNSYCYKHTDRHRQKDIHTQYTRSIQHYSHAHMSRTDHSRLNDLCVHRILLSQEQRKVSVKYKTLADIPSINHLLVNAKFCVVGIGPWRKCFTTWLHRKNAMPPNVVEMCPTGLSNSVLMGSKVNMIKETW